MRIVNSLDVAEDEAGKPSDNKISSNPTEVKQMQIKIRQEMLKLTYFLLFRQIMNHINNGIKFFFSFFGYSTSYFSLIIFHSFFIDPKNI